MELLFVGFLGIVFSQYVKSVFEDDEEYEDDDEEVEVIPVRKPKQSQSMRQKRLQPMEDTRFHTYDED